MARIKSKISKLPADPSAPRHEGVLFVEGVPQTTKSAFKAACATNDETMRDVIIKLMREYARRGKR